MPDSLIQIFMKEQREAARVIQKHWKAWKDSPLYQCNSSTAGNAGSIAGSHAWKVVNPERRALIDKWCARQQTISLAPDARRRYTEMTGKFLPF